MGPAYRLARPPRSTAARLMVLGVVACAVAACSNYVRRSTEIRDLLAQQQYEAALEKIEGIDLSNSELLLLYEKGLVLRYQGAYEESNAAFERAETVLENLYTRSVTRELASMTVSETIAQYRGDAFEAVLVNYYKILNYLDMRDLEGAMVECRRVNQKLQMLQDGGETYFVNDPFVQYVTGMVYEMGREATDAEVSFRTAVRVYEDSSYSVRAEVPPWLFCDAGQLARSVGDAAAAEEYLAQATCSPPDGSGMVTVLLESGEIVQKIQSNVVLPILENDKWQDDEEFAHELSQRYGDTYVRPKKVKYWLKVAIPTLMPSPPRIGHAVVHARMIGAKRREADAEVRAVEVENLNAYAVQAFREKQSTVFVRSIVRALVKYAAFSAASNKDEALGGLVNLFNFATETADTRSWSTLPQAIWMARLQLEPGRYVIDADLFSPDGVKVADIHFPEIEITAGAMQFRTARVF